MTKSVENELTKITYVILDHILENDQFQTYIKNVILTLKKYAGNMF